MYNVLFTQRALKDLENIDNKEQHRIAEKLKIYAREPFGHARKLVSPKIGTYRFRIGEYRVIFDIDGGNIVILRRGTERTFTNK